MDTSTLITAEGNAVRAGIKAPNESRARLNLPPVPGGDSPYMQQQQFSLEALAERDSESPFAKPPPAAPAEAPSTPPSDATPSAEEDAAATAQLAAWLMKSELDRLRGTI